MKRNELVELINEAKEIVDQALPLESSVLKDHLTVMMIGQLMQERLMQRVPSLKEVSPMLDFVGMNEGMIAVELTKLATRKDKEWVWETYCYFAR